jgi:hypothetical protein
VRFRSRAVVGPRAVLRARPRRIPQLRQVRHGCGESQHLLRNAGANRTTALFATGTHPTPLIGRAPLQGPADRRCGKPACFFFSQFIVKLSEKDATFPLRCILFSFPLIPRGKGRSDAPRGNRCARVKHTSCARFSLMRGGEVPTPSEAGNYTQIMVFGMKGRNSASQLLDKS